MAATNRGRRPGQRAARVLSVLSGLGVAFVATVFLALRVGAGLFESGWRSIRSAASVDAS